MLDYPQELNIVFFASLLGSYHCLGMCSPIVTTLSKRHGQSIAIIALYNGGRLFSYAFLGFLAGGMGFKFFAIFRSQAIFLRIGFIILGILMLFLGGAMIIRRSGKGVFFLQPFYETLCDIISTLSKRSVLYSAFFTGIFNGFLPCPLIFAFLIKAASTLDPFKGMVVMLVMGAATIPVMFISNYFLLKHTWMWVRDKATIGSGLLIVYLGIVIILRNLSFAHILHH